MSTLIIVILYSVVALGVGFIVNVGCDPYGHFPAWHRWSQVLLIAPLWPFWIAYVVCGYLYYTLIGDGDGD
jgi:hypothetical protein